MTPIRVTLKPGKEQSLQRYHPWIFSGAIQSIDGNPNEGDLVEVTDKQGNFLALGHFQSGSIMVRVVSFIPCEIDREFWRAKLVSALNLRKQLQLFKSKSTNIFRLVHGEGDGLPGLIIDIYGSTAVIQAHSIGMYQIKNMLAELLVEVMEGTISSVYDKSIGALSPRASESSSSENDYLIGTSTENELIENSNRFLVSWEEGQKTGFFIDQRDNRQLLSTYCNGKNVLNSFCYTGGFSVYAARGGAKRVVSVDSSQKAMELTTSNMNLNFGSSFNHESICIDVFNYFRDTDELFDVIILDPPAFAKHKSALHNALQAYKRLNATALSKLKPGGVLFTFSCSQVVNRDQFRNAVFSGGVIANRKLSILHQLTQPADHPINIYHPEGEYLKGLVLYAE